MESSGGTHPSPQASTDAALTRQYLAEHDISCARCGYNLRGGNGVCPECGTVHRIALVVRDQIVRTAEQEATRLREYLCDRDTPCPRCAVNLRNLQSSTCPSCGLLLDVWAVRPLGLDRQRRQVAGRRTIAGWVIVLCTVGVVVLWLFLQTIASRP